MNFPPANVHEIGFPPGGQIPPKLGQNFILTCAHEIDPRTQKRELGWLLAALVKL